MFQCKILAKNSNGDNYAERVLVKVDQVSCMKIVNVDCSFFYNEYVRVEVTTAETLASMSAPVTSTSSADTKPLPAAAPSSLSKGKLVEVSPSTAPIVGLEEDWLDLDRINELGDLNELMEFLDEARSTFESDVM